MPTGTLRRLLDVLIRSDLKSQGEIGAVLQLRTPGEIGFVRGGHRAGRLGSSSIRWAS